jgi:signal transduction histidine kinase
MQNTLFRLINEMDINPFILRFKGEREKLYRKHYNEESLPFVRMGLFIGIIIYAAYGIFDYLAIEEYDFRFFMVRYLIAVPFGILILALTYTPLFFKYTQLLAVYAIVVGGAGVIAILLLANPPVSYSLYAGLLVLIMANYSLLRIRFEYTVFSGWLLFVVYLVAARFISNVPSDILANNASFIVGTNLIGMVTSYYFDFALRRDYYFTRLLEVQKMKVVEANTMLEEKISNRTRQLLNANKTLEEEIDSRKKEEEKRRKLEEQLFFLQKIETIGTLSGGIAHDFNNILATIMGYTDIIKRVPELPDEVKEYLESIEQSTTRANDLIHQLLTFSKKIKPQFQEGKLNDIINEAVNFIKPVLKENIHLETSIADNVYDVLADHNQIHQVIMNLVSNAQHAMRNTGGTLSITLENSCADTGEEIYCVSLVIKDTGEGMSKETLQRMFEPYYTTKEVSEGHGLGLSMVHGIIENHNGHIYVNSKIGVGTEIEIQFPAINVIV